MNVGCTCVAHLFKQASLSQLCCMLLLLTMYFPADPHLNKETGVFAVMALLVGLVSTSRSSMTWHVIVRIDCNQC